MLVISIDSSDIKTHKGDIIIQVTDVKINTTIPLEYGDMTENGVRKTRKIKLIK